MGETGADSFLDILMRMGNPQIFYDGRAALDVYKSRYEELAYYPYDAHWNDLGAAAFFLHFAENLQREAVNENLTIPNVRQLSFYTPDYDRGSDLSGMLDLLAVSADREVVLNLDTGRPVDIAVTDFDSNEL